MARASRRTKASRVKGARRASQQCGARRERPGSGFKTFMVTRSGEEYLQWGQGEMQVRLTVQRGPIRSPSTTGATGLAPGEERKKACEEGGALQQLRRALRATGSGFVSPGVEAGEGKNTRPLDMHPMSGMHPTTRHAPNVRHTPNNFSHTQQIQSHPTKSVTSN